MQKIVSYRLINFLTDPEHLFSRIFSQKKKTKKIVKSQTLTTNLMPSSEEVEAVSESLDETPLLWLLRSFLRVSSSTSSEKKIFLVHIQSSSLLILELVTGSGTRKSRFRIQEVPLRNGFSPSLTICDNLWAYFNFFQRIA